MSSKKKPPPQSPEVRAALRTQKRELTQAAEKKLADAVRRASRESYEGGKRDGQRETRIKLQRPLSDAALYGLRVPIALLVTLAFVEHEVFPRVDVRISEEYGKPAPNERSFCWTPHGGLQVSDAYWDGLSPLQRARIVAAAVEVFSRHMGDDGTQHPDVQPLRSSTTGKLCIEAARG
jgi:hypothetical protein